MSIVFYSHYNNNIVIPLDHVFIVFIVFMCLCVHWVHYFHTKVGKKVVEAIIVLM